MRSLFSVKCSSRLSLQYCYFAAFSTRTLVRLTKFGMSLILQITAIFSFSLLLYCQSHTKLHSTLFCVSSRMSQMLSLVNSQILQQWNFLNLFKNGTDVSKVESCIMLENNDTLV
jgi:hypothetical protein